jgi:hypothetical protein
MFFGLFFTPRGFPPITHIRHHIARGCLFDGISWMFAHVFTILQELNNARKLISSFFFSFLQNFFFKLLDEKAIEFLQMLSATIRLIH